MKRSVLLSFLLAVSFLGSACSTQSPYIPLEQVPAGNHDVIQVEKAFDYVYLTAFDAVNQLDGWRPDETVKAEGLIRVQNTRFSRFDDSDKRTVYVRVHRDSQTQTSVSLEPESRRIIGADEVLAAIREKLGAA